MPSIAEAFSAHARRLDDQVALLVRAVERRDWPGYRLAVASLHEELAAHFALEEEQLFPLMERSGEDELVAGLRDDHVRARELLDTLVAAAPQHDPEGCLRELAHLATLLHTHHELEIPGCYAREAADDAAGLHHALGALETITDPVPDNAVDLRGLEPPEPIVRIFAALERSPSEPLRAILPHEPMPLYGLLRERGYAFEGSYRSDGSFELVIRPR